MSQAEEQFAITERHRQTLAAIADQLIPAWEEMPAASEVDVYGEWLNRVLGARPDIGPALARTLDEVADEEPAAVVARLEHDDPPGFAAIALAVQGGYYMHPRIRELIGYPGQENRPDPDPDATPDYVEDGLLQPVIDRGPIYKPTP